MTDTERLVSGRSHNIDAVTVQGRCQVREFIDDLEGADQKKNHGITSACGGLRATE